MAESLADILIRCLNEIDEVGGKERHLLRKTIGRDAYDALISKQRSEDLMQRGYRQPQDQKPSRPRRWLCTSHGRPNVRTL